MPEYYRALLAEPGVYQTGAGGPIHITPDRARRWAQEHNRMLRQGWRCPVPFGHKLDAIPAIRRNATSQEIFQAVEAYDEALAHSSGDIVNMEVDSDGRLWFDALVPPGFRLNKQTKALENALTGARITQTSPGIGDFRDGHGRVWKDVILHAALVSKPVTPGQPGFRESPLAIPAHGAQAQWMSTGGKAVIRFALQTQGNFMAKNEPAEIEEDDEMEVTEPDGDEIDASSTVMGDETVEPTEEPPPLPSLLEEDDEELPMPGGGMTPQQMAQFADLFNRLGSPLPPDTNASNALDRMMTMLTSAANSGAMLTPKPAGPDAQALDLGTGGASPEPMAQGGMGGGMGGMQFMSTATGKPIQLDPIGHKIAIEQGKNETDAICAEWDKLAKGQSAQIQAICLQEKALARRFNLSIDPASGVVRSRGARARLADAKRWMKATGMVKFTKKLSTTATPSSGPIQIGRKQEAEKAAGANHKELQAEIARLNGIPVDKVVMRHGVPTMASSN